MFNKLLSLLTKSIKFIKLNKSLNLLSLINYGLTPLT